MSVLILFFLSLNHIHIKKNLNQEKNMNLFIFQWVEELPCIAVIAFITKQV